MGEERKSTENGGGGTGVRDGVTNKEKQSIEQKCLQDFAWQERRQRVYTDTKERDRKMKVQRTQHLVRL